MGWSPTCPTCRISRSEARHGNKSSLEFGLETNGEAARRSNRSTGEQTRKVDDVQSIRQVEDVSLHAKATSARRIENKIARGSIDGRRGVHAAALEVHSIDDATSVLSDCLVEVTHKFHRKTAPVRSGQRHPRASRHLIVQPSTKGVPLVLRNRESICGRQGGCGVLTKQQSSGNR